MYVSSMNINASLPKITANKSYLYCRDLPLRWLLTCFIYHYGNQNGGRTLAGNPVIYCQHNVTSPTGSCMFPWQLQMVTLEWRNVDLCCRRIWQRSVCVRVGWVVWTEMNLCKQLLPYMEYGNSVCCIMIISCSCWTV